MIASNMRIKPHFTIIPHSPDQVELRKGVWNPLSYTLQDESDKGKLFLILNDLNGQHSVGEIAKKHNISRADVESVLDQLQQLGVIEQSPSTLLDYYIEQACPSVMQRLYPSDYLKTKKVLIIGNNTTNNALKTILKEYIGSIECLDDENSLYKILKSSDDQWMHDSLQLESMLQHFSVWKDYFVIFSQQTLNPVIASKFNLIAHELKIPWIHGLIDGPFLMVGPLFTASKGPCYHCFETRISMNLREHASYVKYKNAIVSGKVNDNLYHPMHAPLTYLLTSHLALETLNYLATGTGFTRNKVLSIYLPTMEMVYNEVLRVAACHVCGAVEHRDNGQLYFDYQSLIASDGI